MRTLFSSPYPLSSFRGSEEDFSSPLRRNSLLLTKHFLDIFLFFLPSDGGRLITLPPPPGRMPSSFSRSRVIPLFFPLLFFFFFHTRGVFSLGRISPPSLNM